MKSLIKFIIILVVGHIYSTFNCAASTSNNRSFFYKDTKNIIGFSDLIRANYPDTKSDDSFLISPSRNRLFTLIFQDDNIGNESYVFIEQTDVLTHEVAFSWVGLPLEAANIFPKVIKHIDSAGIDNNLASKSALSIEYGSKDKRNIYFRLKLQEFLIKKNVRVINRESATFLLKIQKNYFKSINKSVSHHVKHSVILEVSDSNLKVTLFDSYEFKEISNKEFALKKPIQDLMLDIYSFAKEGIDSSYWVDFIKN